jgi:hypothetical protein
MFFLANSRSQAISESGRKVSGAKKDGAEFFLMRKKGAGSNSGGVRFNKKSGRRAAVSGSWWRLGPVGKVNLEAKTAGFPS